MVVQQTGVDMQTESCTSGHSPFLSQPKMLAAAIRTSAGEEGWKILEHVARYAYDYD